MNTRTWLFYIGCIGTRALFVFLAKNAVNDTTRPLMAILFAAIAMGFMSIYAFGWRKDAPETFGETGVVWWNHLRPIHAFLYALTVWLLYTRHELAHLPLLLDLWIGFTATTSHNFKRMGI